MFTGFNEQETFTPIPGSFFSALLQEIEDIEELKVTLHALWCIANMEGPVRWLEEQDFIRVVEEPAQALEKAVQRGTLLRVASGKADYFLLNSPRGRQAAESLRTGKLAPDDLAVSPPLPPRPNIFKLYEENMGPLTPMIADALKDAEHTYKPEWVVEALDIAVKKNKRNWKYVEAILHRWKEDGHAKKQAGRNAQEDGRRYTEGEFADFIEH